MTSYRYKHYVSIGFAGNGTVCDPADIVDGFKRYESPDVAAHTASLPKYAHSNQFKGWLKGDTTLLISSIHLSDVQNGNGIFILRLGGEYDDRPHDVTLKKMPGLDHIQLPDPLPLPARMGFYLVIPNGGRIMLFGKAASDVPPPAVRRTS
jgi:hypothetical protein